MTECTQTSFTFGDHSRHQVVARFDGGTITSDGGGVLLRQLEQRSGIVRQFAGCCRDHRQPGQVEHSVRELVSQRVYGLLLEATLLFFIQQAVETAGWPLGVRRGKLPGGRHRGRWERPVHGL